MKSSVLRVLRTTISISRHYDRIRGCTRSLLFACRREIYGNPRKLYSTLRMECGNRSFGFRVSCSFTEGAKRTTTVLLYVRVFGSPCISIMDVILRACLFSTRRIPVVAYCRPFFCSYLQKTNDKLFPFCKIRLLTCYFLGVIACFLFFVLPAIIIFLSCLFSI